MKSQFLILLVLTTGITIYSAENKLKNTMHSVAADPEKDTLPAMIRYTEFKPRQIHNSPFRIPGFEIREMYSLYANELIIGSYQQVDDKFVFPDSDEDYGQRLLLKDKYNRILFTSAGSQDTYLFEPHFFKANGSKTIVFCQMAFEYYLGGSVYIYEKGSMKYIGELDIESNRMDLPLIEILKIHEQGEKLIFTFDRDSLLLNPGGEGERLIPNNHVHYTYDQQKLQLHL